VKEGFQHLAEEKKTSYTITDYAKGCARTNLKIRFDVVSIAYFFGRWIPFSFAIGIVTGSVAAFMDVLILNINRFLTSYPPVLVVYPVAVAVLVGLALKLDSRVGGPGIGFSVIHIKTKLYVPLKTALLKFATATLALSGGFIAGREGPSFFLGVAIGEWLGKAYGFGKRFKNLLGLIGGGAFTGALLKAPLGSSIFAMELENMYDLDYRPFVPMIIASIVSYLTFSFFRGEHSFIPLQHEPRWDLASIPYIVIMGFVISAVTYLYTFLFHTATCASKWFGTFKRPIAGTLAAIPLLGILYLITQDTDILSAPAHMGIVAKLAEVPMPVWKDILIVLFTIAITSLTLAFGIPGGLVLPNLLIGAAIGNMFGNFFPEQIVMFTLAGMGAALAAGAKTPLAAIVMVTEMSHADVVIPMTAAVITSYIHTFGFSLYLGQEVGIKPLMKSLGRHENENTER
jgi:H+/Cl- antiporter ClcA